MWCNTVLLPSAAGVVATLFVVKKHFKGGTCTNRVRLDGKVAIVTGASGSLGKETALELARRGATVVLACPDMTKGVRAAEDIRVKLGFKCRVVVRHLDLSSMIAVRQFARQMDEEFGSIQLLINNASIVVASYTETVDGFEKTMATNHLGHFLLTNLLMEKMKKSAPSRIVNVSSRAYENAKLSVDALLKSEKTFNSTQCYRNSKLANILFTKELAVRLKGSGVVTSCLHPGAIQKDIFRHAMRKRSWFKRVVSILLSPFLWIVSKSCHQAVQSTIYCATEPDLGDERMSGVYISDCSLRRLKNIAKQMNTARQLWETSEKLIREKESSVGSR